MDQLVSVAKNDSYVLVTEKNIVKFENSILCVIYETTSYIHSFLSTFIQSFILSFIKLDKIHQNVIH